MGGFLFNGCGAADTVKKLLLLKTDMCSTCHKEQEFYLSKVQMKIHVVFIPTLPLNTKYAITCAKCKTGVYITEALMRQIMNADEATRQLLYEAAVHPGSILAEAQAQEAPSELPPVAIPEAPAQSAAPIAPPPQPAVPACQRCGHVLSDGDAFCNKCGHPVGQAQPAIPLCQRCGHALSEGAVFCGKCGHPVGR